MLILDDEPSIATMLARVCTAEGHEVAALTNSAEALVHLATAPIDLLVLFEPGQQLALAAAQIEDSRLRLDQVADNREVAPAIDVRHRD